MARAPEYTDFAECDVVAARNYIANSVKGLIGNPLKVDGGVLVNDKTNTRYGVAVSAIGNDGCIRFRCSGDFSEVLFGGKGFSWLALLEPYTSELMLLPWESVQEATRRADLSSVVRDLGAADGHEIAMNYAWAKNALAKKSGIIGKGPGAYSAVRRRKLATKEDFCHLHVHSMYSFLDGVSTPEELVQQAVENGQPGIALTDHGYTFGLLKMHRAAKDAGIKSPLGCEFYIVDDVSRKYKDGTGGDRRFEHHITVLAMDNQGWENLCTLASLACRDNYYYVPRIDWAMLAKYNAGLIVLSGCFKGGVAWYLQKFQGRDDKSTEVLGADGKPVYRRDQDRSRQILRWLKSVFGGRLYTEAQSIDFERYMEIMPEIVQMGIEEGVPVVVTNDVHYATRDGFTIQQAFSKISSNSVGDTEAFAKKGVYFVKTIDEMSHPCLTPDMYSRTCEIMERCNVNIPLQGDKGFKYLFPDYDVAKDEHWAAFQSLKGATA